MARLNDLETKLKSGEAITASDEAELLNLAKYYRKLLAMKTAEYAYLEMKNLNQIDAEVRPLGYRLVKMMNSRIPVLEELTYTPPSSTPEENMGGANHIGTGW